MSGTGITDPSPLGSLTSIGSLLIVGLPIKALSLPSLGTVNGELELRDLANLESVNLPSLTTIATDLTLDGLGKLTTLDGFSAIQSIHAEIRIVSCPELTDITGLTLASDVVPTSMDIGLYKLNVPHVSYFTGGTSPGVYWSHRTGTASWKPTKISTGKGTESRLRIHTDSKATTVHIAYRVGTELRHACQVYKP